MANRTMSRIAIALLLIVCFVVSSVVEGASTITTNRRHVTKGQRKKGWRHRAGNSNGAKGRRLTQATIVTNPNTLGKGKGKPSNYDDDDDGRTTFMVNCKDRNKRFAEKGTEKVSEKMPPEKSTLSEKKGGKGSSLEESSLKAQTKRSPEELCDEYWDSYNGGSGEGDEGSSNQGGDSDGTGEGYQVDDDEGNDDDESNTDGDDYPVEGTSGNEYSSCARIAAGNGPGGNDSIRYEIHLDVIKAEELPSVGITRLMRADLQFHAGPRIADCVQGDGAVDSGVSSGDTLITDVVFEDISGDSSGCSSDHSDAADKAGGACLATTIPVVVFYDGGDTSGFEEGIQDAIDDHQWSVPGVMQTFPVDRQNGASVTAIEQAKAEETKDKIGPAAYLSLAAAALVLLLLAVMFMRRNRRDEMVKHVELGDDDTYLRDMEADSQASPPLADVVGDDGSIASGWTGPHSTDGFFANMESRPSHQDVHVCASSLCEICHAARQAGPTGVQFIPSSAAIAPPPTPPETPRDYAADDTVDL